MIVALAFFIILFIVSTGGWWAVIGEDQAHPLRDSIGHAMPYGLLTVLIVLAGGTQ